MKHEIELDDEDQKRIMVENLNRCQMWMDADGRLYIYAPLTIDVWESYAYPLKDMGLLNIISTQHFDPLKKFAAEFNFDKDENQQAWIDTEIADPSSARIEIVGEQNFRILADAGVKFPGAEFYRTREKTSAVERIVAAGSRQNTMPKPPRLRELNALFSHGEDMVNNTTIEDMCNLSHTRLSKISIGKAYFWQEDYEHILAGFDIHMKEHAEYVERRAKLLEILNDAKLQSETAPQPRGRGPRKR